MSLYILETYPDLEHELVSGFDPEQIHAYIESGKCDAFVDAYPKATHRIMLMSQLGLCHARGMPIGLVGLPLDFGPGNFAMGIGNNLDHSVDRTLNYWMTFFMNC